MKKKRLSILVAAFCLFSELFVTEISKSDIPKSDKSAYRQLREARANARHEGKREKRVREKADEEKAKK